MGAFEFPIAAKLLAKDHSPDGVRAMRLKHVLRHPIMLTSDIGASVEGMIHDPFGAALP